MLNEDARVRLAAVIFRGDPAFAADADEVLSRIEPVVRALVDQARADGAGEERGRWKVLDDAFGRVVTKYTYAPGPGGNVERIAYLGAADMAPALAEWIRQHYRALDRAREKYRWVDPAS